MLGASPMAEHGCPSGVLVGRALRQYFLLGEGSAGVAALGNAKSLCFHGGLGEDLAYSGAKNKDA